MNFPRKASLLVSLFLMLSGSLPCQAAAPPPAAPPPPEDPAAPPPAPAAKVPAPESPAATAPKGDDSKKSSPSPAAPAPPKHSPAANAVMDAVAKDDPAAAFKAATDGHALGDPSCTYLLGQMHEFGRGVPKVDPSQAFTLYEQAAKLGVPEALSATARCLEAGIGTAADPQKAMFYWQMAAEAGDAPALGRMGQAEMEGHLRPANPEAALPWLEKAAAVKDPMGLWLLSKCYDAGLAGLTPSIEKAVGLCSQAAFSGQPEAMQRMGEFYATGRGLPNDPVAATGWFRLAADYGNLPACASLALAYLNGTGCRQNDATALDFASRAAQGGLPRGNYLLGRIYEEGLGLPPDGILGMCFHLRALEKGIGESKTAVARLRATLKPEAVAQAEKMAALPIPELRAAVRDRVNGRNH